jgi:hypothetical protein
MSPKVPAKIDNEMRLLDENITPNTSDGGVGSWTNLKISQK